MDNFRQYFLPLEDAITGADRDIQSVVTALTSKGLETYRTAEDPQGLLTSTHDWYIAAFGPKQEVKNINDHLNAGKTSFLGTRSRFEVEAQEGVLIDLASTQQYRLQSKQHNITLHVAPTQERPNFTPYAEIPGILECRLPQDLRSRADRVRRQLRNIRVISEP